MELSHTSHHSYTVSDLPDIRLTQHLYCLFRMLPLVVYRFSIFAAEPRTTDLTMQRFVSFFQRSMDRLYVPCQISTA